MTAPKKPVAGEPTPQDELTKLIRAAIDKLQRRGPLPLKPTLAPPVSPANVTALPLSANAQAAVALTRRGLRVFPLAPGKKFPRVKGWQASASSDPETIGKGWPAASGPGVATGDGVIVLDIDAGKDGFAALDKLRSVVNLPRTFVVRSANDGLHMYLRVPKDRRFANKACWLNKGTKVYAIVGYWGIDVRAEGGLAVGAGAEFNGKTYTVEVDALIADAPEELLAILEAEQPRSSDAGTVAAGVTLDDATALKWAEHYLLHKAPLAVEDSGGDPTTIVVANRVFDFGISADAASELMLEHWNPRCSPPWDAEELDYKIESALRSRQDAVGRDHPLRHFTEVVSFVAPAPAPDMGVLRLHRSAPPPMPLEPFGALTPWLQEQAKAKSAPVDYVAAGLVATLTAMIGSTRRVNVEGSWSEPAIMWLAVVGSPSTNKSPALDAAFAPLQIIEQRMALEYGEMLRTHEANKLAAAERREAWEAAVRAAAEAKQPLPPMPLDAQTPLRPTRPRIRINNATTQALMEELARHDRGFLLFRDELAGWLGDFDRFGGNGGDRAQYIEMFGGRPSSIDRVKLEDTLRIKFMHTSVVGGIQPDRLDSLLLNTDDDGLTARFLFLWPAPAPLERYKAVPDDRVIERAFDRLLNLAWNTDGTPVTLSLTKEAADAMWSWRQAHREASQDLTGFHGSSMGKMPGYVARLALVLEHAWWAMGAELFPPTAVSAEAVRSAIALVDSYFRPMQVRVLGEAALSSAERGAAVLARAIINRKAADLNVRDVKRKWRLPGLKEDLVDAAVRELVEAGWLRADDGPRKPGRPDKTFTVDPRVHELAANT